MQWSLNNNDQMIENLDLMSETVLVVSSRRPDRSSIGSSSSSQNYSQDQTIGVDYLNKDDDS